MLGFALGVVTGVVVSLFAAFFRFGALTLVQRFQQSVDRRSNTRRLIAEWTEVKAVVQMPLMEADFPLLVRGAVFDFDGRRGSGLSRAEYVRFAAAILDYVERVHLGTVHGDVDERYVQQYLGPTLAKWYLRCIPVVEWLLCVQGEEAWRDARRLMERWLRDPEFFLPEDLRRRLISSNQRIEMKAREAYSPVEAMDLVDLVSERESDSR